MAISAPHYQIFKSLKPLLPHGGTLLEIGEANWYGDMNPNLMMADVPDDFESIKRLCDAVDGKNLFAIAKAFYAAMFAPSRIVSVDMNGTPAALKQDLNYPLVLEEQFDLVINHGTAEHIFDIAQVFFTMHGRCKAGGLMVHESPFTGWIDHGFYCLQPTLYYDMAAANGYEIVRVFITEIASQAVIPVESRDHIHSLAGDGKIPNNSMLFVVMRKVAAGPFRIPIQGYYARTLSEAGSSNWRTLR